MIYRQQITIRTSQKGLVNITNDVQNAVAASGLQDAMCNVFLHHTSASVVINENADDNVLRDLEAWMTRAVVDGDDLFLHREEGPDDMSAHVRAALTATSLTIPVIEGRLALGVWQGVFLWEHRALGNDRKLTISVWA